MRGKRGKSYVVASRSEQLLRARDHTLLIVHHIRDVLDDHYGNVESHRERRHGQIETVLRVVSSGVIVEGRVSLAWRPSNDDIRSMGKPS